MSEMRFVSTKTSTYFLLASAVSFSMLGSVCPFSVTSISGASALLRSSGMSLKMCSKTSENECSQSTNRKLSAVGDLKLFGDNFHRRDIMNILIGLAVAGAGVKSSGAVNENSRTCL